MNSFGNNSLGEALVLAFDEELDAIGTILNSEQHEFSNAFSKRIENAISMSSHRYSTVLRHRIRRSALIAAVLMIVLCMSITVYAIVREHIPFNVGNHNGPWSALVEGSQDESLQADFEYVTPKTPEGFQIEERVEEPLNLIIYYKNDLGNGIVYSQAFGGGGQVDINVSDGYVLETFEETINDRNAIVYRYDGDVCSIVIEDGVSVFVISGDCAYETLYDMAVEVTKGY